MNKLLPYRKSLLLLLLLLSLSLSGCGGTAASSPTPTLPSVQAACQAVLDSGAFSEGLEPLDSEVALDLYATYGLDAQAVIGCLAYLSTGATAEECVFLTFEEKDSANQALKALEGRVAEQMEALRDYQPQEIAKLERALYGVAPCQEGYWAFLVVANDNAPAEAAINALT